MMFSRDATYLDPPEAAPDYCDACDRQHQVVLDEDGVEQEPERCTCRCHWTAEDDADEYWRQRGEDI